MLLGTHMFEIGHSVTAWHLVLFGPLSCVSIQIHTRRKSSTHGAHGSPGQNRIPCIIHGVPHFCFSLKCQLCV